MGVLALAGDVVIDWLIWKGQMIVMPGGAGNVQRGLGQRGFDCALTTIFNPAVFPLGITNHLAPNALQDLSYINTYLRDYDNGSFYRFRHTPQSHMLTLNCDIVTVHKDSCIRTFQSRFADIKDPHVTGTTDLLRLSAEDDKDAILQHVRYHNAVLTYVDHVELLDEHGKLIEDFMYCPGTCLDNIGAGDAFFTALISCMLEGVGINEAIKVGYYCAQEKVGTVGVFIPSSTKWFAIS